MTMTITASSHRQQYAPMVTQADIIYAAANQTFELDLRHAGPGEAHLVKKTDKQTIELHNARTLTTPMTINKQGFELIPWTSHFSQFLDDKAVVHQLYPEIVSLLTSQFNARLGLVFDHTVRSNSIKRNSLHSRAPIQTVHNDYTKTSAQNRLDIELEQRGLMPLKNKRHMFINLWLPIQKRVTQSPLALADPNSFSASDAHLLSILYPDRKGQISVYSHHRNHRWYYYPDMTSAEALIFKVFDSDVSQAVQAVPHSSAQLLKANPDNRSSIEFRSILIFD